jgi:hypothetical protein
MTIDWTREDLSLVYLVRASYRFDGSGETAYWCGPSSRCGSGLTVADPSTGTVQAWEVRLSGGRIDASMQGTRDPFERAGGLSFVVACGADSDDLHEHARGGSWANQEVVLYLVDLDGSGNVRAWQEGFRGVFDRNPNSIDWGSFRVQAVASTSALDGNLLMTRLPDDPTSTWTKDADWTNVGPNDATWGLGNADGAFYPPGAWGSSPGQNLGCDLHPEAAGKYVGHTFGHGATGLWSPSGGGQRGVWREVVVYGHSIDVTAGTEWYYAHVSSIGNDTDGALFVWDIALTLTTGTVRRYATTTGNEIATFINDDATAGPVGTCVRFSAPAGPGSLNWRSGARGTVLALVSGHYHADVGGTSWNAATNPFLNVTAGNGYDPNAAGFAPEATSTPRMAYKEIITDLLTSSDFNPEPGSLGTTAITDFVADAPGTSATFVNRVCAIPLLLADSPPTIREVLGELLQTLGAALVQRWDATAEELRWYPVWRRPFAGDTTADHKFLAAELLRETPHSITLLDDPDREYATGVVVEEAMRYGSPTVYDLTDLSTMELQHRADENDSSEETEFNGKRIQRLGLKWWCFYDPTEDEQSSGSVATGFTNFAAARLDEVAQRQRVLVSEMGRLGFEVELGDLVEYDAARVTTDLGQARRRSWDLDRVRCTLTTWHGETYP